MSIRRLPSEVLVPLLLTVIIQEQGISSMISLLQAIPSISNEVLFITDHELTDSAHALLNGPSVPHVFLHQYDSSPALRLSSSSRFKIFSFMKHTNNLVTRKFNNSLNCLYGRHLSYLTPVLVNVQESAEGDIFYWTMKLLASRAHVPIIIPFTLTLTNHNLSFITGNEERTSFSVHNWQQYISRLPPPFEFRQRRSRVTMISLAQPAISGFPTRFGIYYPNAETVNVDIHPASGLFHDPGRIGLICARPLVINGCPALRRLYVSFKTCMVPIVLVSGGKPHLPDNATFRRDDLYALSAFRLGHIPYDSPSEVPIDPVVLDEFTLENKLWSIHFPFSTQCHYASSDGHLISQAERSYSPMSLVKEKDYIFHSHKVSLIGIPAVLVFHRLQLAMTKEFSWWKLSPDHPVHRNWWESLKPKQCLCLLKLKVFAVVRDREDDPPLVVDAPLLEEVQLVGLVTSEKPWDLNQLLQSQEIHNTSFLKAVKNKLSKRKVKRPPIPGVQLKKVMLGQYSTPLPLSVDWQQLSPAIETMESMAIVGYIPQFVLREVTNYSTHPTFYCLKSFTLDVTWITQYTPTTTTAQVNLCERVYPSLIHLKLVVPQQSWYKFEGILYDDPLYHSFILKIEAPKKTKHITLSSVLLGITVNVNGCQLLKLNVGKPKYMNGVEYTWTKRNEPQVGFQQDLEYEGATFAEEWDFDNCIYDTYKPPAEPCKHLHRGLEEEV